MKIILLADVKGLGKSGQVVNTADGYARNFLFPRNLAQAASEGALKVVDQRIKTERVKAERLRAQAEILAQKLGDARITIVAKAGTEGRLYGAVTGKEIAQAVSEQTGMAVDRRKFDLSEPIKQLGSFEVHARVHAEVTATLRIEIVTA